MYFHDIWAIVTGLASIASLLLVIGDRFANLRKYLVPTSTFFAGFAIARLFSTTISVIQVPNVQLSGTVVIVVTLVIVFGAITSLVILKEPRFIIIVMAPIIIMILFLPLIIDELRKDDLRASDYLSLSIIKEERGDIEGAIEYLKKYKETVDDVSVRNKIDDKIGKLQNELVNKPLDRKRLKPPMKMSPGLDMGP